MKLISFKNRQIFCLSIVGWGMKGSFLMFFFIFFWGCQQKEAYTETHKNQNDFEIIQGLDTLQLGPRLEKINHLLDSLHEQKRERDLLYAYLRGYRLELQDQQDSAQSYFETLKTPKNSEWEVLRKTKLLSLTTSYSGVSSAEHTETIYKAIKEAEELNSVFTYKLYDILAMVYYNHEDTKKALEYTEKYYNTHPFKNSDFIKQRYYDISFLLHQRNNNLKKMRQSIDSARVLAIKNRDSVALMRTYEFESQIDIVDLQPDSAIANMRKYMDYTERNEEQRAFIYSNLASLYTQNHQLDSAQYYYKKAMNWVRTNEPDAKTVSIYRGLSNVYAVKNDFKTAYAYLDTMVEKNKEYEEQKRDKYIEQLRTQYAVEKKDKEIENLKVTNQLNNKIINQERWIFGIAIALLIILGMYGYTLYRRKSLNHRNKQLKYENKSLLLEQRLTQMQINPHFIHNSIANLQGLIIQGEKKTANSYLVSLSKLIRNVLELNRREFISIQEEIEALKNYIKLQQMRDQEMFTYSIDYDDLDPEAFLLPPMLLQPFVENSIEHGFSNLSYPGKLLINFKIESKKLHIHIEDNGEQPFASEQEKLKKESLSQIIIQERLNLLFNQQEKRAWYDSDEKKGSGEKGYVVDIYLPVIEA